MLHFKFLMLIGPASKRMHVLRGLVPLNSSHQLLNNPSKPITLQTYAHDEKERGERGAGENYDCFCLSTHFHRIIYVYVSEVLTTHDI